MAREEERVEMLHIAMFPYFAFGHINPFIHLSNNLSSHGIRISFLSAPANIPKIKASLSPSPNTQIIPLTIPPVEGLQAGLESTSDVPPSMAELLKRAVDLMQPQIKSLLSEIKPSIVFFDFAQYWIPQLASNLGIKSVYFSVFSAFSNSYLTVPSRIKVDETKPFGGGKLTPIVEEMKSPPKGYPRSSSLCFKTFQAQDFLYIFKSFDGGPSVFERVVLDMESCDAMVYKSCLEMESPYIDYLQTQYRKPVLLAGLALPDQSPPTLQSRSLHDKFAEFLDKFPPKSVIFCSFGSESFLKVDQLQELALGLELTRLPFLLVLNLADQTTKDHEGAIQKALPSGFLERVKDRGMVTAGWVPQRQILSHESVGCYVCHCGFSSVVEALVGGCQLVLIPLKGDQFLNSKLLSLDMKVGVEVNRREEDGYFGKLDVYEAVKTLMVDIDKEPGRSIRANQVKWREFLMQKEVHEKYVSRLVEELKNLAWGDRRPNGACVSNFP